MLISEVRVDILKYSHKVISSLEYIALMEVIRWQSFGVGEVRHRCIARLSHHAFVDFLTPAPLTRLLFGVGYANSTACRVFSRHAYPPEWTWRFRRN